MAFTQEEEDILRLMLEEVKKRKTLDAERKAIDMELRNTWTPLEQQIRTAHKTKFDALANEFMTADQALEAYFDKKG